MIELLKTILSASVVAGIVSFLGNQWSQRRQNRLAHLREQLEKLYGPLVFSVRTNAATLAHHQKLTAYGDAELGETARINWQDPEQVARNSDEIDMLMVVQNDYGATMVQRNKQMVALIQSNYHLIDAEDQEVCESLVLNVLRLELESTSKVGQRLHAFRAANPVLIVDPKLIARIETSFAEKHAALREAAGVKKAKA